MVMSGKDPNTLKVIDFGLSLVQDEPRCGSYCFSLLNHEETYNVTGFRYMMGFIELDLSYWPNPNPNPTPGYNRIQTQSIRAPEVTLDLLCTTAIDMWSFGCCLIELLIGREAFYGDEEYEQLTRTIEVTAN
jgi:serine/threonine protein kinase